MKDGKLRRPLDAEAWKNVGRSYLEFGMKARNVGLGLASDGFSPFGLMSAGWSTWSVLLMSYNLPRRMCMKQLYMILLLLILIRYSLGNDIDVFVELLIDELNLLWDDRVMTYDTYSKKNFKMHMVLLWTVTDFPAYDNLLG